MSRLNAFLGKIPALLSSKISIFIYLFLFVYLVLFGLAGLVVPWLAPSAGAQLVLGNYTNVLSALGASIAAGIGTVHASRLKDLHRKHDELMHSVAALHAKVDSLSGLDQDARSGDHPGPTAP